MTGFVQMGHNFQHRTPRSLTKNFLTIGETIQKQICDEASHELYGLLEDDGADISEQIVIFIQYYSAEANNLQVKRLCVIDVLEDSDSANETRRSRTNSSNAFPELDLCNEAVETQT